MTAQKTNLFNAFETTLATTMGSSDTTLTVAAVTDSYPTTLSAPFYIVINPDSATNREVILVTAVNTGTKELTTSVPNRYLQGSAASSGLSHSSGQVVRMAPLQQHIEDINDRVDTIINEDGTEVNTSLFLDEDDMVSDSDTKGVTQQSVKAYVDSQVTAQDLDFLGDSGSGAVDLDSQDFTIAGTANEIETSASGQTLTIGLPSTITTTLSATSVLSDGVVATTQSASDNSTKVATTAYVDAQVTAEDLDFGGDTGTGSVDLDSQTFTIQGTTNEIETSATGQTLTIGLPSSITVDVTGNLTGNVTGNVTGDLTGNVTATSVIADGVTATTQSAGDNSTKIATTAYVDSISVDDDLTFAGDTGSGTVDLDTQTFTVAGTANEIETSATGQTLTIGLPSSITVDVVGNLTGNADTATTAGALSSAVTVSLTGDVAGSATFTSAGDTASITTTIQADSVALGTDTTGNYVEDVTTSATSGLNKTSSAGEGQDVDLVIDPSQLADGTSITVDTSNDFLILEDVTDGSVYKVNPDQIASGSANALIDGDSDLTITDGLTNGLDYDLDNTDMATWNAGGIALTTNGGMFRHNQTQAATFTIASGEGTLLAGPITITGTVTNNGTMVVI